MNAIQVREATDEDFDRIIPLLELWIAEANPDNFKFEPKAEIIRDTLRSMRNLPIATTLILEDAGELVGCLGLIRHAWGASHTLNFVSENLWYVRPEYAGHANRLMNAAKQWAKFHEANYLMFSTNRLSTDRSPAAKRWLTKLGFRPLYELFITEV